MSGIIHKIEEEIKHALHLGHKEEGKHQESEHKAEHGGDQPLKELMHKIKKKMGGRHGKKRRGEGRRKEGEEYKEGEGEEEEDEEEESESESESDEEESGGGSGGGGGEFEVEVEFEF